MNMNLFYSIMNTQSVSQSTKRMQKLVARTARRAGAHVFTHDGNVYVTKGQADIYPCVVAHTDTVHDIVPQASFKIGKTREERFFGYNPKTNEFSGIGGDDKVGILVALEAIQTFDNIKAVFFRDEEIGCRGAAAALMGFFDNVSFVAECDRKGFGEVVDGIWSLDLMSDEFRKELKGFQKYHDFKYVNGAMTDVMELKEKGLPVSSFNMSCGYYNPHTHSEYVILDQVKEVRDFVFRVIEGLGTTKWPHIAEKQYSIYGSYASSYSWLDDNDWVRVEHNGGAISWRPREKAKTYEGYGESYEGSGLCPQCHSDAFIDWDDTCDQMYCTICKEYIIL